MSLIISIVIIYLLISIVLTFYLFQSLPLKYKLAFGFGWPILLLVGLIGYWKVRKGG